MSFDDNAERRAGGRRNSWITEAPFSRIYDPAEVLVQTAQFRRSIAEWVPPADKPEKANMLADIDKILGDIEQSCSASRPVLVYNDTGPKGFCMTSLFEDSERVTIQYIVGDPTGGGIGRLMIQEAVNYAESKGFGGKIHLIADSEGAAKAYGNTGFTRKEVKEFGIVNVHMNLDPAASPLWEKLDGRWRFSGSPLIAAVNDKQCCVIM